MTDKQEQDKVIIQSTPDRVTHYDYDTYVSAHKETFDEWDDYHNLWCAYYRPTKEIRSIEDIAELVSLRDKVAEQDKLIAELEDKWVSGDEIPEEPQQYYLVAIRSPDKFGLLYEVAYLGAKFEWYKNHNGDIELWMPIPEN